MIVEHRSPGWMVQWYAADTLRRVCYVCDTKQQAMEWAKEQWNGDKYHYIPVDWIPFGSDPRKTISDKMKMIDARNK